MGTILRSLVLILCAASVLADDIQMELQSGILHKMLREMATQSKADTMNLPANATSIRENITDTFSCDNRTYGYYADVDNECQIFHVCLPSQSVSGRAVTYRWSFICPAETVFNQEVLTCTRPREAIPCEDSPAYYDINMEFGKVANESKENQAQPEGSDNTLMNNPAPNTEAVEPPPQRWNQANRKKQNIIVETLFNNGATNTKSIKEDIKEYDRKIMDSIREDIKNSNHNMVQNINKEFNLFNHGIQDLKEEVKVVEKEIINLTDDIKNNDKEKSQEILDSVKQVVNYKKGELVNTDLKSVDFSEGESVAEAYKEPEYNTDSVQLPQIVLSKIEEMNAASIAPAVIEEIVPEIPESNYGSSVVDEFDNSRIASERSLKRTGRKINRGTLKFRSNI
ncbi:uncharacterized protein PF3D7_1120000 [Battus philenor]|uniref:uncharacterized protein PF3D7_1120000 n=1 Tax=Battus philenor TaxID=42288 RepID=UPI0035D05ACB